jgi:hypothetical protein
MQNPTLTLIALTLTACAGTAPADAPQPLSHFNIVTVGCDLEQDGWSERDILRAINTIQPGTDNLEILCKPGAYFYTETGIKVAGTTSWPGTPIWRGRVTVAQGFPAAVCSALPHEILHLTLWRDNGDGCGTHSPKCGWDAYHLSNISKRFGCKGTFLR